MRLSRLGFTAVLLVAIAGPASASSIQMHDGSGSIPFYNLNFGITFDTFNSNTDQYLCFDSSGQGVYCLFRNDTGESLDAIQFAFQVPTGNTDTFSCEVEADSPFRECNTQEVFNNGVLTEVIFSFFDGSVPSCPDPAHPCGEFGLNFPGFEDDSTFGSTGSVPEPGSAMLLLTALGGSAIVLRKLTQSGA